MWKLFMLKIFLKLIDLLWKFNHCIRLWLKKEKKLKNGNSCMIWNRESMISYVWGRLRWELRRRLFMWKMGSRLNFWGEMLEVYRGRCMIWEIKLRYGRVDMKWNVEKLEMLNNRNNIWEEFLFWKAKMLTSENKILNLNCKYIKLKYIIIKIFKIILYNIGVMLKYQDLIWELEIKNKKFKDSLNRVSEPLSN